MRDMMIIGGLPAVITATPSGQIYRGVFVGLSGQVDFYAACTSDLKAQGEEALRAFLSSCRERKCYPLQLRNGPQSGYVLEDIYAQLDGLAEQRGISLNSFVQAQLTEFMAVEDRPAKARQFLQDDLDEHYFC
nr:type II toxin-antitoxin system HicB family antitoxin [uncultured Acetobacter sp.]